MPRKRVILFPRQAQRFRELGERLRLARLRRQIPMHQMAVRVGITRASLYRVEDGDQGVSLGVFFRCLAVLGLDRDFDRLAADDHVGRVLQDMALPERRRRPRKPTSK